jgi:hypothetical protein
MGYSERLISEYGNQAKIEAFLSQIAPLNIDLRGGLLVIGPGPDLIDLVAVEPFIGRLSSINLIDEKVDPRRNDMLEIFKQYHPRLRVILSQGKSFQSLTQKFNSVIFFGSDCLFLEDKEYLDIPRLLKPGGIFYATSQRRKGSLPDTQTLADGSTMTVIEHLPHRPGFGPEENWTGIIIEPARC